MIFQFILFYFLLFYLHIRLETSKHKQSKTLLANNISGKKQNKKPQ